ncbi:hypothetical protein [Alicyclobacillus fodiniaquatilis]|uniref:Uncharacterized protein n=1 Tax=Alicyclobacillus fodiniaquatilis TaxID=1661150 RepID=A0ABW4JN49_9BACL
MDDKDWMKEIAGRIKAKDKAINAEKDRIARIGQIIERCVVELKENYNIHATLTEKGDGWEFVIHDKQIYVTTSEIENYSKPVWGVKGSESVNDEEALKRLILDKFKWD